MLLGYGGYVFEKKKKKKKRKCLMGMNPVTVPGQIPKAHS